MTANTILPVIGVALLTLQLNGIARGEDASREVPRARSQKIDQSLFPKAYGVLGDESLMHPVDMSNWPVKIDSSRQLFVDDYLIASMAGLTRAVHPIERLPGNPLLVPDKPWEGVTCLFYVIHRDEQTGKWRTWYAGRTGGYFPALYAESEDGIHWTKPELGLHEFNGSKANNILIPGGSFWGIFDEPNDPDPKRRFKGIVLLNPNLPNEGYYLHTSPDGIHWSQAREEPIALSSHGYTMPTSGIGDTTTFRWDDRLKKYIGDVKFVLPPKMRCRGMMESEDLIHWTRPRITLYPDAIDDPDSQIYSHRGFIYESMWIGFNQVYHENRDVNSNKQTPIELTASRDGRHWTRVGNRQEVIPITKHGHWDAHYIVPAWHPFLVDEELWIYYSGSPMETDKKGQRHSLGLGKLRRDGFVSLDANGEPGTVVTRPLTFGDGSLFVNAEIGKGGYIKAELRNTAGKPILPFTLDQCTPLTGDQPHGQLVWGERRALDQFDGHPIRVAFELKNAKLYSFWIGSETAVGVAQSNNTE